MAIIKELTITVNGSNARLSKDVYLYLGDGQTTLLIEVTILLSYRSPLYHLNIFL